MCPAPQEHPDGVGDPEPPSAEQAVRPGVRPIWLKFEMVLEEDGKATHIEVEGHPERDCISPENFTIESRPGASGNPLHIDSVLIAMNLRLDDVSIVATNDVPEEKRKRKRNRGTGGLRALD